MNNRDFFKVLRINMKDNLMHSRIDSIVTSLKVCKGFARPVN